MPALSSAARPQLRNPWLLAAAAAALTVSTVLVVAVLPPSSYRIDVDVYCIGGQAMLDGRPLYGRLPDTQIGENLPFTYPPVAALLFTVFALVPLSVAGTLLALASTVALFAVLWLVIRAMTGLEGMALLTATTLACAVGVWFDPFRQTLEFGQINVLLMLCVVVDVLAGRGRWWRGIFVGLAISVKLTPAVFLAFFLVRRDWRAMAVTGMSVLGWTGIGFLVRPHDSWQYWTQVLPNTSRIGEPGYASNQSLNGLISRIAGDDVSRIWWFLGCAIVGLFVLALIYRLGDDEVAGMTAMGLYALFASPISWSHHWVWMVPLVLVIVGTGVRCRSVAAWVWTVLALGAMFSAPQWWWPFDNGEAYHWNWYQTLLGNTWLWLLLASYVILWVHARQLATRDDSLTQS